MTSGWDQISLPSLSQEGALNAAGVCPFAEVWIEPTDMSENPGAAAYLKPDLSDYDRTPYTTTGRVLPTGLGMRRADLRVSTTTCWYLDATFCQNFNQMKESGWGEGTISGVIRTSFVLIMLVSSLYFLR